MMTNHDARSISIESSLLRAGLTGSGLARSGSLHGFSHVNFPNQSEISCPGVYLNDEIKRLELQASAFRNALNAKTFL